MSARRRGVSPRNAQVAVAGDSVEVKGGKLYVNGRAQDEAFINEQPAYALDRMVVPAGHVFVLGDNRNLSTDSHVWGCVPLTNVIGKAFYVLWPQDHQGFVDQFMQDLEIEGVRAFTDRING